MYRKEALHLPPDLEPAEAEAVLGRLVEQGALNPKLFNATLDDLRARNNQQAHQAVENKSPRQLLPEQKEQLFFTINNRFKKHQSRHRFIFWYNVEAKLKKAPPEKLWSLWRMEETGGMPDVVDYNIKTKEYIFFDCSIESPIGRSNLPYDKTAEEQQKIKYPDKPCNGNMVDMAAEMGIEILDSKQYREILQKKEGGFDINTNSRLKTLDNQGNVNVLLGKWYRSSHTDLSGTLIVYDQNPYAFANTGFRGWLAI